ncbi:LOW QUALITY PROTEIN: galanin receptor 2b-like [Amazona ochrocephala]
MMEHEDSTSLTVYNSSDISQFSTARIIVSVVFFLIFLLGTVGNSLVLAVLLCNRQMVHNTTNPFIFNLSLAEFFIAFCVPFQDTIYFFQGWVFGSFICKAVYFFIYLTMYASSFTLTTVSVLDICYPLRSQELWTPHNAVAAMAVIWGLSVVFAGPYVSYYDLIEWESSYFCMPGWEEWRRKVMDTSTFAFGYDPQHLWTAVEDLEDISESKKAKRKVTKMIIIVTILFCLLLSYHLVIPQYLYGDFPFNQATYAFHLLSHCMAYATSCLNPIVYALVSKHFCKDFRKVFSCFLRKEHRNKVHVMHMAHIVPGFEAGSTGVSQTQEENNRCELNPASMAVQSSSFKPLHIS